MAADKAAPAQAQKKPVEPLSPFEVMNKYRVPILVVCVVGLFGFGIWGVIAEYFNFAGRTDPDEVVATWKWNNETFEVTRKDFGTHQSPFDNTSNFEEQAGAVFARIIRDHLLETSGSHVSESELKDAFETSVKANISRANPEGKFDKATYREQVWGRYNLSPAQYEIAFREGLEISKFMEDIDRIQDDTTTSDIYEMYRQYYSKVKLKGIFFSQDHFKAAAKLPTEKVADADELTAESREKLNTWWRGLSEIERKRYHRGGAVLTVEGLGFRFKDKADDVLETEFKRESALSKTSLEKLTSEFTPDEADLAKMKLRLGMFRELYGVTADEDIEKSFEARKARLTIEWKIWKLMKKLHAQAILDLADAKAVDFNAIAQANNLQAFKWTNIKIEQIMQHEEFPGVWATQLPALEPNRILDWIVALGPQAPAFDAGPVDEFAKHVSIFRLLEKNLTPEPVLTDVLKEAIAGYETAETTKLMNAAVDGFKKAMDDVMTTKAKEFIDRVNAETAEAIKTETAGLNAETDKAKIEEITRSKNAEAESRIADEKSKYRSEAFDVALAAPPAGAVVVEEGFFKPDSAATETPADREKADLEAKARSSLRREFAALKDSIYTKTLVSVGTVSEPVDSPFYPGLKGIAKLVEKKEPTVEDMFFATTEMQTVEAQIRQKNTPQGDEKRPTIWDYNALKRVFALESDWADKAIEREKESRRKAKEKAAEFAAQQQQKNLPSMTAPSNTEPAIPR